MYSPQYRILSPISPNVNSPAIPVKLQYRILSPISPNVNSPAILALISSLNIKRYAPHSRILLLFHHGQFRTNYCNTTLLNQLHYISVNTRSIPHIQSVINLFRNIKRCLPRYRILSPISTGVNSPAISVSSSVESSLLFQPVSIHQQHQH